MRLRQAASAASRTVTKSLRRRSSDRAAPAAARDIHETADQRQPREEGTTRTASPVNRIDDRADIRAMALAGGTKIGVMIGIARYAAVLLLISTPAYADWVDRAWDAHAVEENRIPAITLGAAGVLLVLPEETLDEAHQAGVSTPQAAEELLKRYGQRCSSIIDLDRPHPHLKVQLFLARRVGLMDAPPEVRDQIGEALTTDSSTAPAPDMLSVTSEKSSDFFIDYVPSGTAVRCVSPADTIS
jgi:hypothetical protein